MVAKAADLAVSGKGGAFKGSPLEYGISPEGFVTGGLNHLRSMLGRLHARGIYTLVDMHQDVLSGFTCGEGIPDWAFSRALELVGFNASADRENPRRFPKPLPYDDVDPDPATGKPPLDAVDNAAGKERRERE